jgi:hypothetical protein
MSITTNEVFVKLMENEKFVKEMLSQQSEEDVKKLYAANGVELTIEDVREIGKVLNSFDNEGELNEIDLEDVSGGIVIAAATCWAVAKAVIGVGAAALAVYKWYKSR